MSGAPELQAAIRAAIEQAAGASGLADLEGAAKHLDSIESALMSVESEARRRERQLRLALDAAEVGAWNHEIKSDVVLRTRRHDQIFGYPEKVVDWSFATFIERVVPADRAAVRSTFDTARSAAGRVDQTFRIQRADDGRMRWVRVAIASELGPDGAVAHMCGLITDVTSEQEADQRLRLSEERYRLAAGAISEAVWDWAVGRDAISWTETLTERFGYAPANLETSLQWWLDRMHPEDRADVEASLEDALAGEGWTWSAEYRWARSDGSWAYVLDRAAIVREGGQAVRMVGALQDLTHRKTQEAELAAQKAQLRTILETAPVGIIMAELPSGRIVHGNSWIERNLKHPVLYSDDIDSYDEWVSFHADGSRVAGHEYPLARIMNEGAEAPELEVHYQRGDGSRAWMRIMGRPVRDEAARLIGGVVAMVDVDAERQAQEDLRRLNQELEARVAEQVAQRLRVEEILRHSQKMEAVGQLTGGVAHDFNNLLTVMIGGLEEIVARLDEAHELRPLADMALTAAERGAELTGQLLSFSRQRAQQPVAIAPRDLLRSLEPLIKRAVRDRISVEIRTARSPWAFLADRAQLEAAVLNLCINARDAMPEGGTLKIAVSLAALEQQDLPELPGPFPATYGCLTVADDGAGMTPEVLQRATEPFFTSKSVGRGTGLGLSMVYGFVKQSGGTLRIHSEVGKGTSVSLLLPLAEPADDERPAAPVIAHAQAAHILVVEDDDLVRQQTVRKLRLMGHMVVEAPDADHALELLKGDKHFDLLFTDVVMPGSMDGRALAFEALRLRPSLPILFTTGYADLVEPAEEPWPGAVIGKPYKQAELVAAIAERLAL